MKALIVLFLALAISGCASETMESPKTEPLPVVAKQLRGASSYTPYDAFSMMWCRGHDDRTMAWVSSGGEAGRLLVSTAAPSARPDWVLCTQGVVAGLAARGENVVIIASTYSSDQVLRPVFRIPKMIGRGSKSLFIPRTSIEFAFDRLLQREGIERALVSVPSVEKVGFTTIASLLAKPASEPDALDFAILVDPFITNLMSEYPGSYEIGAGGLYQLDYCLVVRREDLQTRRKDFVRLLQEFVDVDERLSKLKNDPKEFQAMVWGRSKDGQPEYLPDMITYDPSPAVLQLDGKGLRARLEAELKYLTEKYPDQLEMPTNIAGLVDTTLLTEVSPSVVKE